MNNPVQARYERSSG